MYAIGNIIWGCPLGKRAKRWLAENGPDEWEEMGITTLYSGSSEDIPAYLGVQLAGIDETTDAIRIDLDRGIITGGGISIDDPGMPVSIRPTDDQIREVENMMEAIPDGLRATLPPIGLYIVWSTS